MSKNYEPEILADEKTAPTSWFKCHEFDVRPDAARNQKSAEELVNQGGLKRLPYAFEDGVVPDGRTGILALILMGTVEGKEPSSLPYIPLKGKWSDFSDTKKAAVRYWALDANLPSKSRGHQRFAGEADIRYTIKQNLLGANVSLADTVAGLQSKLPVARIEKLYAAVLNEVTVSQISKVNTYAVEHDCTQKVAVGRLGYPQRVLDTMQRNAATGRSNPGSKGGRFSPQAFIKKRQPLLNSALDAMNRYGDVLLTLHRDEKMSGITAINIAKAHLQTADKTKRIAEDTVARVTSEVHELAPGTHRF